MAAQPGLGHFEAAFWTQCNPNLGPVLPVYRPTLHRCEENMGWSRVLVFYHSYSWQLMSLQQSPSIVWCEDQCEHLHTSACEIPLARGVIVFHGVWTSSLPLNLWSYFEWDQFVTGFVTFSKCLEDENGCACLWWMNCGNSKAAL